MKEYNYVQIVDMKHGISRGPTSFVKMPTFQGVLGCKCTLYVPNSSDFCEKVDSFTLITTSDLYDKKAAEKQ